jgi:precorrin-2/cobalt-factor-2 C20-methyltransferase
MSILYGVSVGAGDPQLMTLKALRIIEECGTIAVPRTNGKDSLALSIAEQAADLGGKRIVFVDFPMSRCSAVLEKGWEKAAELLCGELENGSVAFLTLGDISVYSTFSYIVPPIEKAGHEVRICAGVTSFCAAAAALKEPLCLGDEPMHIIPFGCEGFDEFLEAVGTKIVMKTGKNFGELKEILRKKGLSHRTSVVENCGLPDERVYRSIDDINGEPGYFSVFIIRGTENET